MSRVAGSDEAAFVGEGDELGAVAAAELAQSPADVRLRGQGADHEAAGDLGVGQTASDEAQDLALAFGQLGELIERARSGGLDVTLDVRGERPARLPEAVQLAAYRIVQESLTNAQRHAAGAPARVALSFDPERLLVTVENGPGTAGNGHNGAGAGLIGMRERAETVGGTLRAASSPDGFRVAAELPYRRGK